MKRTGPTLSRVEREFLFSYMEHRCNGTEAWLAIRPDVERASAANMSSRCLRRIKQKLGWTALLDAAGLDDVAIVRKLRQLLDAQRPVHYKGEEVGLYEDGQVQLRATELLAEFRGHRRQDPSSIEPVTIEIDGDDVGML